MRCTESTSDIVSLKVLFADIQLWTHPLHLLDKQPLFRSIGSHKRWPMADCLLKKPSLNCCRQRREMAEVVESDLNNTDHNKTNGLSIV